MEEGAAPSLLVLRVALPAHLLWRISGGRGGWGGGEVGNGAAVGVSWKFRAPSFCWRTKQPSSTTADGTWMLVGRLFYHIQWSFPTAISRSYSDEKMSYASPEEFSTILYPATDPVRHCLDQMARTSFVIEGASLSLTLSKASSCLCHQRRHQNIPPSAVVRTGRTLPEFLHEEP